MLLIFDREFNRLSILTRDSGGFFVADEFPAANNVASNARGPWPSGLYRAEKLVKLEGEQADPNGPYGQWFLRFIVPDRDGLDDALDLYDDGKPDANDGPGVGMGIHAGRRDGKDAQGRMGYQRATMGCIRTDDEAMDKIAQMWERYKKASLVVL